MLLCMSCAPKNETLPPIALARTLPLNGFHSQDLRVLSGLLDRGTVGLVEFADGDDLPGIHFATLVQAPTPLVADVIGHPERYPDFMPGLDRTEIVSQHENTLAFKWKWRASIFQMSGTNSMTRFESANPAQGYRFEIQSMEGDLGSGRTSWRLLPWQHSDGSPCTLVMLSTRIDLRDANYIARQLSSASRSINRSLNLTIATALLMRAKSESEKRHGHVPVPITPTLQEPSWNVNDMDSLFYRGDVFLLESNGEDVARVAVVGIVPKSESEVREVMKNPELFAGGLIQQSTLTILERTEHHVQFQWKVNIPIFGSQGIMNVSDHPPLIHLDSLDGALKGGHWRWKTRAHSAGTLVMGWANFEVADVSFIIRALVDADGSFRPGLSASAEVMLLRALRTKLLG